MNNLASNTPKTLRVFRVGILGASPEELNTITRVCSVTQYRTRRYQPVRLPLTMSQLPEDIDIVVLAQGEDAPDEARELQRYCNATKPVIRMIRRMEAGVPLPDYCLKAPLNPAKFLKMLDQYTIRELNYFPEFEIGSESSALSSETLAGISMLTNSTGQNRKQSNLSASKALVVDDSLAVRRQMEIEFQLMNKDVDVVDCAESAMLAVNSAKYSIIFLDVVMPGMDGYAACKKIKRSPLNKHTPIVMLTSRSSSFDKFKGTLAGCDAYLVKPINHNEFEKIYNDYARVGHSQSAQGGYANGSK